MGLQSASLSNITSQTPHWGMQLGPLAISRWVTYDACRAVGCSQLVQAGASWPRRARKPPGRDASLGQASGDAPVP